MDIKNQMVVVGFGHRARQGKGTAVKTIYDFFKDQYNIKIYGFGDCLKEEVNEMDQFETCMRLGIKYDPTPPMDDPLCQSRHGKQSPLLQYWGEYRRKQDSFYWVKKVRDKIIAEMPRVALIHDVRYKNEYAFVKACGGFTVKVTRLGFIDLTRDPKHISETDLDGVSFDCTIEVQDGAEEELKNDSINLFQSLIDFVTPKIDNDMPGVVLAT